MFSRILIANRGEIACRIMRTAHRLGVSTVAVYSDADAGALHAATADHAVRIGPAPVTESYLQGARIIEAALGAGAEAIHPGYGFLSENPEFVEAVTAAGLVFIGPPASAIRAMGLKGAAKTLMAAAGVPIVPGYHGESQDDVELAARADEIGYPLLVKAVAGGGGKGMRLVKSPDAFADALASARSEACTAFGNADVLLERYVTAPRHIEIQIFADAHGNVVHLFERDCSLQRRHQKVIEEAPAPGMTPEMRAAMGNAAVQAARTIGYRGAGTIEFIVDGGRGLRPDRFWFMEMNTRLQVEHPVTEAITGQDLVEWQLRVAAGEPLPRMQEDLAIDGHAFEARLYAEDPARGFLPATGTLTHLYFPPDARVDTGVRAGDAISPYYDPMIAKLVVHGPTRASAQRALARALDATRIAGSTTNLAFLARLARQPDFLAGRVETGLIARDLDALTRAEPADPGTRAVALLAGLGLLDAQDPLAGFALWDALERHCELVEGDIRHDLTLAVTGPGRFRVSRLEIAHARGQGDHLACTIDGVPQRFGIAGAGDTVTVFKGAEAHVFTMPDPLAGRAELEIGGDEIRAPMPGLLRSLAARKGAKVRAGEVLAVLEAMKMEHGLTAPRDGIVAEVLVEPGAQVTDGTVLLTLEPGDG